MAKPGLAFKIGLPQLHTPKKGNLEKGALWDRNWLTARFGVWAG